MMHKAICGKKLTKKTNEEKEIWKKEKESNNLRKEKRKKEID